MKYLIIASFLVFMTGSALADNDRIAVCHKPQGENPHIIWVNEESLQSHLDHGDNVGDYCLIPV